MSGPAALASVHRRAPSLKTVPISEAEIAGKIAARLEAKKAKNYGLADQLRAELASHGIMIEDRPDGTSRWKR